MTALDFIIEMSNLFDVTQTEGETVSVLFDQEIAPLLKDPLCETDIVGLGDRFNHVLDKVRGAVNKNPDRIRMLKDMMKASLLTYIEKTHDAVTGRQIFHKAIMSGSDTMLTVTAATMLANALVASNSEQAQALLKGVATKLTGRRQPGAEMWENASSGAVSTGAIATASDPKKRKSQMLRRRDSIFAESMNWDDLQGKPEIMKIIEQIAYNNQDQVVEGILIDPTTAELLISVHTSLTPSNRRRYEAKPLDEMIAIAYRAVQRGLIQVVMESA